MPDQPQRPRPIALIVLDGWGLATRRDHDATEIANARVVRGLLERCPHGRLEAAGEAVGLPEGVIGNSEVGHLNLGAGRVVYQELTRIDLAIRDGSFFDNPALGGAMDSARLSGGRLHLAGLVSDAGVHSHIAHLEALLAMAKRRGLERVFVHAFTDGRDSDPRAGAGYLERVQAKMRELGVGRIASVCGRYWIMDRDKRWDRTQRGYDAMVRGQAPLIDDPVATLRRSYDEGTTDEFVEPCCVTGPDGGALAPVEAGDSVIIFNFRADRVRQLSRALSDPELEGFERPRMPAIVFAAMTRYERDLKADVAFEPQEHEDILGAVIAKAGLHQVRLAETEKYAHVTYFLNGGEETPLPGEERIMVPSDRSVATYDLAPSMRAKEIADEGIARITKGPMPDLLVVNFANADMVGHSGNLDATVRAVESVDQHLGRLLEAIRAAGGAAIVTADHGNAEQMTDPDTGQPHTAHTLNPVPVILYDGRQSRDERLRPTGKLCDVAPTLLQLMGLPQPQAMTGRSLLER